MATPTLTRDILLAALAGFQLDKQRIESQIADVQALLNGSAKTTSSSLVPEDAAEPSMRRGKRSAAVRKRMAEAQKARWAKIKGESVTAASPEPAKAKRHISAEGMKNIIAATKKRWRLQKAAEAAAKKNAKAARKAAPAKKTAAE